MGAVRRAGAAGDEAHWELQSALFIWKWEREVAIKSATPPSVCGNYLKSCIRPAPLSSSPEQPGCRLCTKHLTTFIFSQLR